MSRNLITDAKRIVIKIGSSSLTGSAGSGLDAAAVDRLVDVVLDTQHDIAGKCEECVVTVVKR